MNECEKRLLFTIVQDVLVHGKVRIAEIEDSTSLNFFTKGVLSTLAWQGLITERQEQGGGTTDKFWVCSVIPGQELKVREYLKSIDTFNELEVFKPS